MGSELERIRESCEIDAPVAMVYEQFRQFEEFPRFMEGIETVHRLSDRMLEWTAEIGGQRKTWMAEITAEEPERRIAWRARNETDPSGEAAFERLPDQQTLLTLEFSWKPESVLEKAGSTFGIDSRKVKNDLENFRDFVETGRTRTTS